MTEIHKPPDDVGHKNRVGADNTNATNCPAKTNTLTGECFLVGLPMIAKRENRVVMASPHLHFHGATRAMCSQI